MTSGPGQDELRKLHEALGARWTTAGERLMPRGYGQPEAELAALRTGCALWDDAAAGRLVMGGDDRARFLNGLVTCDVAPLDAGQGAYGLFTDIKGRVLADVTLLVGKERLWLRVPTGSEEALREHMQRYVITDRVEIRPADELLPLMLAGPEAVSRLADWSGDAPPVDAGAHRSTELLGEPVRLAREPGAGPPRFSAWVAAERAAALVRRLLDSRTPPTPVGCEAVEAERIAIGRPRFGVDFGPDNFPQEADLDHAVSYEKGCYLGQEVVARIHFRGGVRRCLRGLRLAAEAAVAPGDRLRLDDRDVGLVSSVTRSVPGEVRALAMLAEAAVAPGTRVGTARGDVAEVLALPFPTGA